MDEVRYDNKSRLGLTLQDYHQVIALSQTNINQSLKRHFNIDQSALKSFHAQIGKRSDDPDFSLTGQIDAPTIQLIDEDKADQAIYTLKFRKGAEYMYWAADDDDPRGKPTQRKVSAEGWTIAFFVSFAMEKAGQLPKEIKDVVLNAGSYSVEQLVIVFGTAELLTFKLDQCTFPNLSDSAALLDVKTNLGKFIDKWLVSLKSAGPGGSHNILGYTVKLDVKGDPSQDQLLKKKGDPTTLSFPPTSVQFQTIANKKDAESKGEPSDPYNAFLFTEMTGNKALPNKDLQWSGNWFYGSIGGTMDMSSFLFLRSFVGPLVVPLHKECCSYAVPLAKRQTWDAEARLARARGKELFLPDWTHQEDWVKTKENSWQMDSHVQKDHYDIPWVDNGKSFTVQVNINATMTSWLVPIAGTGVFEIRQRIMVMTRWTNHSIQYTFEATSTFFWKHTVTLTSISSGALQSKVEYSVDKPTMSAFIIGSGKLFRGVGSTQTQQEGEAWAGYEKLLLGTIENRMTHPTNFTNQINEGLNGQKKFIFPGGGTFDMCDPVFSQAGDLLIGLVYVQGEL